MLKSFISSLGILFIQGCVSPPKHIFIEVDKFEDFYKSRKILPILVDTRSYREYDRGHLNNAINIKVKELFLLDNLDEITQKINAQKHNDWVLFLYAKDENQTKELKKRLEELSRGKFKSKSPHIIYYLKGGYESTKEFRKEQINQNFYYIDSKQATEKEFKNKVKQLRYKNDTYHCKKTESGGRNFVQAVDDRGQLWITTRETKYNVNTSMLDKYPKP
jgi:rhodanese-related sulfurtransferase